MLCGPFKAVHHDLAASEQVYEWVVCIKMGEMRQIKKYFNAATSLGSPSSAARALAAGAKNIERVDKLVQAIDKSMGLHHDEVDATVALVDAWLEKIGQQNKQDWH